MRFSCSKYTRTRIRIRLSAFSARLYACRILSGSPRWQAAKALLGCARCRPRMSMQQRRPSCGASSALRRLHPVRCRRRSGRLRLGRRRLLRRVSVVWCVFSSGGALEWVLGRHWESSCVKGNLGAAKRRAIFFDFARRGQILAPTGPRRSDFSPLWAARIRF